MAIASDTEEGTILLAGDLAGGGDATAPQLSPTGVTPGEYKGASIIVDSKGRIVHARVVSNLDIPCANNDTCGIVKVNSSIDYVVQDRVSTISLKPASKTEYGVVQLGEGFTEDCCDISALLPIATTSTLGGVYASDGITITQDGAISTSIATTSKLGLIKTDNTNGLSLTSSTLNFNNLQVQYPSATPNTLGLVKVPTAGGLYVDNGSIKCDGIVIDNPPNATTTVKGLAYVPTGTEYLNMTGNTLSCAPFNLNSPPYATQTTLGLVFPSSSELSVSGGVLSCSNIAPTSFPYASATTRGVVSVPSLQGLRMVGDTLNFLSVEANYLPASSTQLGVVKIGSELSYNFADNIVHIPAASATNQGMVAIGPEFIIGTNPTTGKSGHISYNTIASTTNVGMVKLGSLGNVVTATPVPGTGDGNIEKLALNFTPPKASTAQYGVVKYPKSGVFYNDGDSRISASFPVASTSNVGVCYGDSSFDDGGYFGIRNASTLSLGVVKIGGGLSVVDGKLCTSSSTLSIARSNDTGTVIVGDNINLTNGTIGINTASGDDFGLVSFNESFNVSAQTPYVFQTSYNHPERLGLVKLENGNYDPYLSIDYTTGSIDFKLAAKALLLDPSKATTFTNLVSHSQSIDDLSSGTAYVLDGSKTVHKVRSSPTSALIAFADGINLVIGTIHNIVCINKSISFSSGWKVPHTVVGGTYVSPTSSFIKIKALVTDLNTLTIISIL